VCGGGVVDVVGVVVNDELDVRDGEQGSSSQSPSGDLCGERGVAPRNSNQMYYTKGFTIALGRVLWHRRMHREHGSPDVHRLSNAFKFPLKVETSARRQVDCDKEQANN
jgi:hypothetical protein